MLTPETIARLRAALAADAAHFGLGAPLAEPRVGVDEGGMVQPYQRGIAAAHRAFVNAHGAVWGTIGATWSAAGQEAGPLHYPIGGEIPLVFPDPNDRWARFTGGAILWQAATNTTRTFLGEQGDDPSLAPTFRARGCVAGIGVPDLQCWFDAAQGLHVFPDNRVSIWRDVVAPHGHIQPNGYEVRRDASTTQSNFWPTFAPAHGHNAVRFGNGARTGLPFAYDFSGKPYTVFAVVQRDNGRGDNHFLFSEGRDCGIFGCAGNSSLHLGWQGSCNMRFGQYGNDLDMHVPDFRPDTITVVGARSSTAGKLVTVDEHGFSDFRTNTRTELLHTGPRSYLGCRAVNEGGGPDYHFEGRIFEVMIFDAALSDDDYNRVKLGLKRKYAV
ncbi:LGFP repeat-containing protein [Lysobacter claricitrinus]|uniref:LGFP repeat-containing protein n=1 Tax=Lysobacter claricitrinus TaxID=3367728 RepID=UPI0037DADD38